MPADDEEKTIKTSLNQPTLLKFPILSEASSADPIMAGGHGPAGT
jgi:hypothetical protein